MSILGKITSPVPEIKVFETFEPLSSLQEEAANLPLSETKFTGAPNSFTQVTKSLTTLSYIRENTASNTHVKNHTPESTDYFIKGLNDEKQAHLALSTPTIRRGLKNSQVALLLARIKDFALIKENIPGLPKQELLYAAHANQLVALALQANPNSPLSPEERISLQLQHQVLLRAWQEFLKIRITNEAYNEITATELEYLTEPKTMDEQHLLMMLIEGLLSEWKKNKLNKKDFLRVLSYLLKNIHVTEKVITHLQTNQQLTKYNPTTQALFFIIGKYHPHFIEEYFQIIDDYYLCPLAWFHESLAIFMLTQSEFQKRMSPVILHNISFRFPKLGIFILRNQTWCKLLTPQAIFDIGMSHIECADLILERNDLRSQLSESQLVSMGEDRHDLATKILHHRLTPQPYLRIFNSGLSRTVLENLDTANPEAIVQFCLHDPTFAYSLFYNTKAFIAWVLKISVSDLVNIASQNKTFAEMLLKTQILLTDRFNVDQVAFILSAHSRWALELLENRSIFRSIINFHGPNLIYKICCQKSNIAKVILCDIRYKNYLKKITNDQFIIICCTYPAVALEFFTTAKKDAHKRDYLKNLSEQQHLQLMNTIPELKPFYPDHSASNDLQFAISPTPFSSTPTENKAVNLMMISHQPKEIMVHFDSSYTYDFCQEVLNAFVPDYAQEGSCAGLIFDFLLYQMENEPLENATYVNVLAELRNGNKQHIYRVHFMQKNFHKFINSCTKKSETFYKSNEELTEDTYEFAAEKIIKFLLENKSVFIATDKHALGLYQHPITGQILFFEPNKKIWNFTHPCQNLKALLIDRLRCANQEAYLRLTLFHIPLHALQLDSCLKTLFSNAIPNRLSSVHSKHPKIEKELEKYRAEKNVKNLFFNLQKMGLVALEEKNDAALAATCFTQALKVVDFIQPNEDLWLKRIVKIRLQRGLAYFKLGKYTEAYLDLTAVKNETRLTVAELAQVTKVLQQIRPDHLLDVDLSSSHVIRQTL